ncbi:polysaccharide biosynthesis tyrosine autokinase [Bradyrhizobium sp. MOS002]|uniref:polysaccharide biosynthesis tyrosine autokinase n=1 Tax=Bradyrhizobium sp. MOS002 TaxID=2133947 RepID=UPI000D12CFB2|nr:polysaccharide biosynthesis tyrosine autokinase [Bradyrhizobium sp. MOS002]PSO25960.1 exopolysaccharide biosynthesis protein [Bradyrhizobium sp. MOS002]
MDVPLNLVGRSAPGSLSEPPGESFSLPELLEQLTDFVRRHLPLFLFIVSCAIAIGLVFLFTASPSYTAHAKLLIDSSKLRVLQQQDAPITDAPIDSGQVETQLEIIKSETVGLSVIKELKLTSDPEFVGQGAGLVGKVMGLLGSVEAPSETALTRRALAAFLAKRAVTRVGRTYVLDIAFSSLHPGRAASIANNLADAYIVDQLEAKYQATKRASGWLQDRIRELRQQASDADRAVLAYKEKNNIVSLGGGSSRLLGEQQLEELNTQLSQARAGAQEAKSRLDRINEVMQKDVADAAVADSLHSEVITRLRNNYLDLAAKEAIWSARYGSSHLAAVNLRTQMNELRRSIQDELGRIALSYKSDSEIAKSRVDGLERSLSGLVSNSQALNRDRLGLRDLESTAQVYQKLYDSFLQRYMEAIQQQSFPITEARIISEATAPQQKSFPLPLPILGIATVVGIILSFAAATVREAFDRAFRTTRQVETLLHVNCLAVLPLLESIRLSSDKRRFFGGRTLAGGRLPRTARETDIAAASGNLDLTISDQKRDALKKSGIVHGEASVKDKLIAGTKAEMRHVVDHPLTAFAEAFRSVKIAVEISGARQGGNVIGITSTVPREGKSTVASNFAQLMAHAGKHVVLVDGDLKNPTLTRSLSPGAKEGLLEVLEGKISLEQSLYRDAQTNLNFLPVVLRSRLAHSDELLASELFKDLVERLRTTHDYVIIDFPPMAPVVDVRATTRIVDGYLYVVEWGKTRANLVQNHLKAAPEIHDRLLGVILNKADVRVLERYEAYYGRGYYQRYYGSQYGYSG